MLLNILTDERTDLWSGKLALLDVALDMMATDILTLLLSEEKTQGNKLRVSSWIFF